MTRRVPVHQIISEHDQSRSYQPSNTGIAAYYQAEQTAGLAVCPPPLHRVNSNHHVHGESPAEEVRSEEVEGTGEVSLASVDLLTRRGAALTLLALALLQVFFAKPSCDGDEIGARQSSMVPNYASEYR